MAGTRLAARAYARASNTVARRIALGRCTTSGRLRFSPPSTSRPRRGPGRSRTCAGGLRGRRHPPGATLEAVKRAAAARLRRPKGPASPRTVRAPKAAQQPEGELRRRLRTRALQRSRHEVPTAGAGALGGCRLPRCAGPTQSQRNQTLGQGPQVAASGRSAAAGNQAARAATAWGPSRAIISLEKAMKACAPLAAGSNTTPGWP